MRIEKIIKELEADEVVLMAKHKALGVDVHTLPISNKEWAALHSWGVLTGYKFYLNRIRDLRRRN